VVIGRDTRESSRWIANCVASGLALMGAEACSAGVITTPAIAHLVRSKRFAAGVVISASHFPWTDNGIIIFSTDGYKLTDIWTAIEQKVFAQGVGSDVERQQQTKPAPALPDEVGLRRVYIDWLTANITAGTSDFRVLVDCANGAASAVAPEVFRACRVNATFINACPNGKNINQNCGSLHVHALAEAMGMVERERQFDLGVTFDGDGDRALFSDARGHIVDGDHVLLLAARDMQSRGLLSGMNVVATAMSTLGLENALCKLGIRVLRVPVGDNHVVEEMRRHGATLGGEPSGHIIFHDGDATIGDGLLTALRVVEIMKRTGNSLADLVGDLKVLPQIIQNVRVREKVPFEQVVEIRQAIESAKLELGGKGRLIVRYAGGEPLARVMVEGESEDVIRRLAEHVAHAIKDANELQRRSISKEYIGLALIEGKYRLIRMIADGTWCYLDHSSRLYDLIYTASSETRALEYAIEELEDLLNSRSTREEDLQRFFEDNPDFITSDDHIAARADVYLTREGEPTLKPDFMLKPRDPQRTGDILELKLPSAQIYVLKSRRVRLSQAVMEARAQLMEYARYFDEAANREFVEGTYGIFAYRPRMFVLIGRRGDISPIIRRRAELTADDLHVFTYDDIIQRMRHKIRSMTDGRR